MLSRQGKSIFFQFLFEIFSPTSTDTTSFLYMLHIQSLSLNNLQQVNLQYTAIPLI